MRTNYCPNGAFNQGVAGWAGFGTGAIVQSQDVPAKSCGPFVGKVSYSTGISGEQYVATGLTIGNQYIAHGIVWNPTGNPSVAITVSGIGTSSRTNTNAQWQQLSFPFTATATSHTVQYGVIGTGGTNLFYIDQVMTTDGSVVVTPIDGDQINCVWAGTPGNSASMYLGMPATVIRTNILLNPNHAVDASDWSATAGTTGVTVRSWAVDATAPSGSGHVALFTWTTGATAPNASVIAGTNSATPANRTLGVSPGQAVTQRMGLKSSVSGQVWRASITFYDASNASTGTTTGTSFTTTAGVWGEGTVTGAVAPANTVQAVITMTQQSGSNLGIGATVAASAGLAEVTTVLNPWFAGDSPNAQWFGTRGSSESQQLAVAQNPNWPVVGWKVWTQEDPPDTPFTSGPTTDPLFLADRSLAMSTSRGRQYELDQDETGTASVQLINDDGGVTAGSNGRYPMRLSQCTAAWAGVIYPVYTGYVDSWPDQDSNPATGRANLELVDLLAVLSCYTLRSVVRESILGIAHPPTYYWPLTEDTGATTVGNATSTSGPSPVRVDAKAGAAAMDLGGTAFLYNSSETGLMNTSGVAAKATQFQIAGPTVTGGQTIPGDTTPWFVSLFVQCTAGASVVWSAVIPDGTGSVNLVVDVATGVSFNLNGFSTTVPVTAAKLAAGVQVGIGSDGSQGIAFVNGVKTTFAYSPGFITFTRHAIGHMMFGPAVLGVNQGTFTVQHVALWVGSVPPDAEVLEVANAGINAFSGDTVEARIARVQKWTGQTGLTFEAAGLLLAGMDDTTDAGAIDTIRTAVSSANSRLFVNESGLAVTFNRNHGQSSSPRYVFGSNTGAGEFPYTGGPGYGMDTARIFNEVKVSHPGGADQRAVNAASDQRYFNRRLSLDTRLSTDADAAYTAQWYVGRYGNPDYRIQDIRLEPHANPALWPVVLGVGLSDVVQVNHKDLSGTKSGLYQVAKISHDVDAQAGTWVTTLSLTPHVQFWVLAAMHTTTRAGLTVGATSMSLNPLTDVATNPAEYSIGVGTTLMLDPGLATQETVTVTSVTSAPTPLVTGYTSITVGVSALTQNHANGAVCCDPLPAGFTDPTAFDSRSVLSSTAITSY